MSADSDQGFFAYMLLGRHRVGRYSALARRPPAAYVHHHFSKPWGALRFLQGGEQSQAHATAPPAVSWPKGWRHAAISNVCWAYRYLRAIGLLSSSSPTSTLLPTRSPCLREMRRELEAIEEELSRVRRATINASSWPLCVEDCKLAPDNPGNVVFQEITVF